MRPANDVSLFDVEHVGEITKGAAKHRYLYVLGNRTQRRLRNALVRLPTLPYPKHDLRPGEGA